MTYIFRSVYHSLRNVVLYREPRFDRSASCLLQHLEETTNSRNSRFMNTEVMLSGFGLKVVEGPANQIPRSIRPNAAQRKSISMVTEYGYRVGLR
jgi:hypothetical protein